MLEWRHVIFDTCFRKRFESSFVFRLLTGAEAESQDRAKSPVSQQEGRSHQAPRGNKARRRPGSNSHPPTSSSGPITDEQGSPAVKKIGETTRTLQLSFPWIYFVDLLSCCQVSGVCESSLTSPPPASNIDRSVKDLQRCTASLTRYRMVVKDEMDSSIKRMKQTFAELQSWYVSFLLNSLSG